MGRTILITVWTIAILASAVANGFFYFKNQKIEAKLNSIAFEIESLHSDIQSSGKQEDIGREVREIADKLDEIGSDVDGITSKVRDIEADVSAIQLQAGY